MLNDIIFDVKLAAEGKCCLTFVSMDISDLLVVTPHDASFAQEQHWKSQMGFMNIMTTSKVFDEKANCSILEFESSTIKRRVNNTMAAESAALSTAIDRHLYCRLLLHYCMVNQTPIRIGGQNCLFQES